MPKIVFDLDGVLRDIISYLEKRYNILIKEWYWNHGKKDIYKLIKEDNYRALIDAEPTDYLKSIIKNFDYLEIWTNQPIEWLPYTNKWIDENIKQYIDCEIKIMSSEQKEKLLVLDCDGIYLVEDYPNFKNYKNIILVDRLYNRNVICKHRVKNGKELINKLKELGWK